MKHGVPFTHTIKERSMEELKRYFQPDTFIEYCKACQYYNKIWACPPYSFDVEKLLEGYRYAYIMGSKLYIDRLGSGFHELQQNRDMELVANEIFKTARLALDERLDEFADRENEPMVLYAGRCLLCDSCNREAGKPCIYPGKMHYSLESIGFDVASICEEVLEDKLQWAKDTLPEYFLLVSAVFSREPINICELEKVIKNTHQ